MIVYDKSVAPCLFMPFDGVDVCHGLTNTGREQHTYAHYVSNNFDLLPSWVVFTPSDVAKHGRQETLTRMFQSTVLRTQGREPVRNFFCAEFMQHKETKAVAPLVDDGEPLPAGFEKVEHRLDQKANCTFPQYGDDVTLPATPSGFGTWMRYHVDVPSGGGLGTHE